MVCRTCRQNLSAFLDGELTPQEAEHLEEHLSRCPACAEVLGQYRQLHLGLAAVPAPEVQPEAWARLRAEAAQRTAQPLRPRETWRPLRPRILIPSGALALLLLALLLVRQVPVHPPLAPEPSPLTAMAPGPEVESGPGVEVKAGGKEEGKKAGEGPAGKGGSPGLIQPSERTGLPVERRSERGSRLEGLKERLRMAQQGRLRPSWAGSKVRTVKAVAPLKRSSSPAGTVPLAVAPTREGPAEDRIEAELAPAMAGALPGRDLSEAMALNRRPAPALAAESLTSSRLIPLAAQTSGTLGTSGMDYHILVDSRIGRTERWSISDVSRGVTIETEKEERTTDGLEIASASLTVTETQAVPDPETGQLTLLTIRRPTTIVRIAEVPPLASR